MCNRGYLLPRDVGTVGAECKLSLSLELGTTCTSNPGMGS